MILLRSLLFSGVMITSTLVTAVIMVLLFPLPFRILTRIARGYACLVVGALRILCGIRYEVQGEQHIRAINSAAIIFAKHQSTWETYALQQFFPPHVWVLKRELMWIPFFGWGMAALRPIAIDRGSGSKAVRQVVEQGRDRLQKGIWIMIFPEGTRMAPGQSRKWGIGGAILAEKTQYPVIPVAHNAGHLWPKGAFLKRPGVIQVRIGPAIETQGLKAAEINAQARAWIEQAMTEIEAPQTPSTPPPSTPPQEAG